MTTLPWEEKAIWTTDRQTARPGHFGDPDAELRALTEHAALLPFHPMGMIVVDGEERVNFLSGLITNQIRKATPQQAIYGGLLSAQGRFLYDFTILEGQEGFILLTEAERAPELMQRLDMYRLRSRVAIRAMDGHCLLTVAGPRADQAVAEIFPELRPTGEAGECHTLAEGQIRIWRDPRLAPFGWGLLATTAGVATVWPRLVSRLPVAGFLAWEEYRTLHGLSRAGAEWLPEETLPLEAGFLEYHGVDFGKGCYVGQETTARTHHRATLRKRLFLLTFTQSLINPPPRAPIVTASGKEAGVLTTLSPSGRSGLGILRLGDHTHEGGLFCQEQGVTARQPSWATWSLV